MGRAWACPLLYSLALAGSSNLLLPRRRRHCKPETVPRGEPRACFHCAYTSSDPRNFRRHLRRHQKALKPTQTDVVAGVTGAASADLQLSPRGCSPFVWPSRRVGAYPASTTSPTPPARTQDDCQNDSSDSYAGKRSRRRRGTRGVVAVLRESRACEFKIVGDGCITGDDHHVTAVVPGTAAL